MFAEQRNAGYAVFAVVDMLLIFVFRSFSGASNVVISPLRGKKQKGKEDCDPACDAQYRRSIIYMLDRLNTEGLLEAMYQVLTLTRQAEFCKQTSNQKTKEGTEWQEKGQ